jgi:hypothetical protein
MLVVREGRAAVRADRPGSQLIVAIALSVWLRMTP